MNRSEVLKVMEEEFDSAIREASCLDRYSDYVIIYRGRWCRSVNAKYSVFETWDDAYLYLIKKITAHVRNRRKIKGNNEELYRIARDFLASMMEKNIISIYRILANRDYVAGKVIPL